MAWRRSSVRSRLAPLNLLVGTPARGGKVTDAQRLLELVGEAYSFDGLADFRPGILEVLVRAVPSDWVSYNEVNSDPARTVVLAVPPVPEELVPAFVRLAHENPILVEILRTGDGRPRRFSDLVDRTAYHRLALYREFYQLVGVESQVAFTLPARPPLTLGIALCRGPQDYSAEEVSLLAAARPHLIQAYRNAELSSARAAALSTLEGGLDSLGQHLVLLDPQGRIELATAGARRLLGEPADTLPAELRAWVAERRSERGGGAPLVLHTGGGRLLVRLLPARPGDRRDILLLEGGTGELSIAALRALGLSARQAETLRWVALGESAAEAARRMGVAPRTIDKHLQNVYAKLGVSSLSEASATAWAAVGLGSPKVGPLAGPAPTT
jgi:DNA-binding CsgD family transcriptional regulator